MLATASRPYEKSRETDERQGLGERVVICLVAVKDDIDALKFMKVDVLVLVLWI